jgi:pyruvate dehydrogenase E1 component alpha subunit
MATQNKTIEREKLLEWYRQIVLIRQFETKCDDLYKEKKITGVYLHLYSGLEATGVGAVAALRPDDHVITAYRDHGIAIARGVDPKPVMAEMMGKKTGTSGGKGGSMHLASAEHNFWGGYAIVAGHLPLAAGIALKVKYNNEDNVVLCFMGDGATNNGYFHESLNLSAVWDLPVVWLIENNLYGMGTPIEKSSGQVELHKRAEAYNMKDFGRVDGQDVTAVYERLSEAVDYARTNSRPVLLEAMTFRYLGHGVSDRAYATRTDELQKWHEQDPISVLRRIILDVDKDAEPELKKIEVEAARQVAEAVEFAENSPMPDYNDLVNHVYVEE